MDPDDVLTTVVEYFQEEREIPWKSEYSLDRDRTRMTKETVKWTISRNPFILFEFNNYHPRCYLYLEKQSGFIIDPGIAAEIYSVLWLEQTAHPGIMVWSTADPDVRGLDYVVPISDKYVMATIFLKPSSQAIPIIPSEGTYYLQESGSQTKTVRARK